MRQVVFKVGNSGPGSLLMQLTGHTATQTSQPVQLSGLMRAFGRPLRGAATAIVQAHVHEPACFRRSATIWLTILPSAAPAAFAMTVFMMRP